MRQYDNGASHVISESEFMTQNREPEYMLSDIIFSTITDKQSR